MSRYVGVRDNHIVIVSDKPFAHSDLTTVVIDDETVASDDILCDYRVRDGQLLPKYGPHEPSTTRLALVGNWKMPCGISTYAENLWPEVVKHIPDVRVFAEDNPTPTTDPLMMGSIQLRPDQVEWCWKRGTALGKLVESIDRYDPDIVWIQHEWGLFPDAKHWLAFLSRMAGRRVIVTLHSVFPTHLDKTVCEAAIPEMVVHLDGAREALRAKGVTGRIEVIPHGCYPLSNRDRLWNLYRSERTVLQMGFGFRYKSYDRSLRAVALLKDRYPDVFFTGLFSESPFARLEHQRYYEELTALIDDLGIAEHVALIRGYQSEKVLDTYLRMNRVALFPYAAHPEHEVFGASGAARLAMSKGIPVVTSRVNHFSDLPTLKADSPEEIAEVIGSVFGSKVVSDQQVQTQCDYIEATSWPKMAGRYLDLFRTKRLAP